jgi:hypothetical protein
MAEDLHQNGVAFPTTNGMLNKDTDVTQGGIGRLLRLAQWRVGVLFTLARLLCRDVHPITPGVGWHAQIASIDPHLESGQPVQLRRNLLFEPAVIVIVTPKRPPQKDHEFVRQGHDRILPRLRCFFPR